MDGKHPRQYYTVMLEVVGEQAVKIRWTDQRCVSHTPPSSPRGYPPQRESTAVIPKYFIQRKPDNPGQKKKV